MRLSCNGCRVLRKGCTDACTIRPCLQWIKAPDAQANATVFLAKFYGRAGLLNLIDAAPDTLRPAVFRSLLYEACGRIVNPIYGSVGLLWSGNWAMCQAAVEAVLKGQPIVRISDEDAAKAPNPAHLHKAAVACSYDIRHVAAKSKPAAAAAAADAADAAIVAPADEAQGGSSLVHKVAKPGRTRTKKRASSSSSSPPSSSKRQAQSKEASDAEDDGHRHDEEEEQHVQLVADHASSDEDTHHHHHQAASAASMDTDAEAASHVSQAEQATTVAEAEDQEHQQQQHPGLDLTLGFGLFAPVAAVQRPATPPADAGCSRGGWGAAAADEPGVVGFRFL